MPSEDDDGDGAAGGKFVAGGYYHNFLMAIDLSENYDGGVVFHGHHMDLNNDCVLTEFDVGKDPDHDMASDFDDEFRLKICVPFVMGLVEAVGQRFPEEEMLLLDSFSIFEPRLYPKSENQMKADHWGEDYLKQLLDNFSHIDAKSCCVQFPVFRKYMHDTYVKPYKKTLRIPAMSAVYKDIVQTQGVVEQFPVVMSLFEIALVQVVASVECERGFSREHLIVNKHRTRLSNEHVEQALLVALFSNDHPLHTLPKHFFDEAIGAWRTPACRGGRGKQRRLNA